MLLYYHSFEYGGNNLKRSCVKMCDLYLLCFGFSGGDTDECRPTKTSATLERGS